MYAWERSFQRSVYTIRDEELKTVRSQGFIFTGFVLVFYGAPFFVSNTIFVTEKLIALQLILLNLCDSFTFCYALFLDMSGNLWDIHSLFPITHTRPTEGICYNHTDYSS